MADSADLYRTVRLIRRFEQRAIELVRSGVIVGGIHPYIGEEAIAAGVCAALRADDLITSTHRGHGHVLAKGADPARMLAELAGRETGLNRGRGGSMHAADFSVGIYGANAIVGAVGRDRGRGGLVAPARRARSRRRHVLRRRRGQPGRAARNAEPGLAAAPAGHLRLREQPVRDLDAGAGHDAGTITGRAEAFGIPAETVDGMDPEAVLEAASGAVARARAGDGPTFLECLTYRFDAHHTWEYSVRPRYRTDEEVAAGSARDPLEIQAARVPDAVRARIDDEIEALLDQARRFATRARSRTRPGRSTSSTPTGCAGGGERPDADSVLPEGAQPGARPPRWSAIRRCACSARTSASRSATSPPACSSDSGRSGSSTCRSPSRRSPASRPARRWPGPGPVVEFQIPALLFLVFEQIANQAHKFSLMTGGQVKVPVTYLLPSSGSRVGWAGQHSDHPYSLFAHVGVKTVVPATPTDAYGLLVSAIRDDDPVIVFGPAGAVARREDVDFGALAPVPLGVGRVHRPGTDVTVVAVGHLVHDALAVADELAEHDLGRGVRPAHAVPVRLGRPGGVAGAHRQARRGRRLQPDLRHRRRDPGHRRRGDAPDRPAETGHPPRRRGAAVRPRARPRRCSRPAASCARRSRPWRRAADAQLARGSDRPASRPSLAPLARARPAGGRPRRTARRRSAPPRRESPPAPGASATRCEPGWLGAADDIAAVNRDLQVGPEAAAGRLDDRLLAGPQVREPVRPCARVAARRDVRRPHRAERTGRTTRPRPGRAPGAGCRHRPGGRC